MVSQLYCHRYQLYHHAFFFTPHGDWCVVQGMCDDNGMARRYHWLSEHVASYVDEPREAVCCDVRSDGALDLVARENEQVRDAAAALAREKPQVTLDALVRLPPSSVALPRPRKPDTTRDLRLPRRHELLPESTSRRRTSRRS